MMYYLYAADYVRNENLSEARCNSEFAGFPIFVRREESSCCSEQGIKRK